MEERIYLNIGDEVEAADGTHKWDGKSFGLNTAGDLHIKKDNKSFVIHYAFDLDTFSADFGRPFYVVPERLE